MAYAAQKDMTVEGQLYTRGQIVPGAVKLPTLGALIALGFLRHVDDRDPSKTRQESLEHSRKAAEVEEVQASGQEEISAQEADMALLDGNLEEVELGLGSVGEPDHVDQLLEAELSGKTRKGAVEILLDRFQDLAGRPHDRDADLREEWGL